jgi:hypothetical protein
MCFGGSPKIESPAPAPTVAPAPSPVATSPEPAEESASKIAEKKRKQLAAIKYGIGSTVKTSGTGDTSSVNLLLPALAGSGLKEKLGQ